MSRMPAPAMIALLNDCTPPSRVLAHMVPTRIIRIIAVDEECKTLRVEQLVEHSGFGTIAPKGAWATLSTHGSMQPGGSLKAAFEAASLAQRDLVAKLKRRIAARQQMARNGS